MNELRQIPLLRLVIPFLLGIASKLFFSFNIPIIPILSGLLFLILFLLLNLRKFQEYHLRWIYGFCTYIFLFLFGIILTEFNISKVGTTVQNGRNYFISATITEPPSVKEKSVKTFLEIEKFNENKLWKSSRGKVIAYIQKDSASEKLELGDQILFYASLNELKSLGNPYEFNYKKYLSYHFITQQSYIKSGHWKLLKKENAGWLYIYANKLQKKLLSIYEKSGLRGDEFAVASALTIGYTDKIDVDVKRAYSATGAMHILSVSGLHVGIVFIVFNFLLFFLDKIKHGKIIKAVIIILLLWFYAMLTGLSAAVLRAAAMFTFVVIGKSINRPISVFNSLAASAFFLLVFNPFYLADIGFQLSYLAVFGIVLFQPGIYKLIYVKNWILDKIWVLISVSIAAQLITFPLSLYTFHQFPNYFLLTNIIVIPVSTIVLYVGIALFLLSFWNGFTFVLGNALSYSVKFLNETILYIEHLPYSLSGGLNISLAEVFLLYLLMSFISLFLFRKKLVYLKISLMVISLIMAGRIVTSLSLSEKKQIVIYNIPGKKALGVYNGNSGFLFSNINSIEKNCFLNIENYSTNAGIKTLKKFHLDTINNSGFSDQNLLYKNNFIKIYNTELCWLSKEILKYIPPKKTINIDYLVVSEYSFLNLKKILQFYNPTCIIIDSSQPKFKNNKLKIECAKAGIKYFNITEQGAFVLNL